MKKSNNFLDNKKVSFYNSINNHILVLFGLISITCVFSDFYYKTSNLTIPFIITTLVSSIITFIGIPKLKKIRAKQIIREEGPKNHFLKQYYPMEVLN